MRVIVLGGLGNFGARICRALAQDPLMECIAASRSARDGPCSAALDLDAPDFAQRLAALRPGLVIHCAGPFQGQDYRVARAACDAGAHYIDLSDGRDFVAGFADALGIQAAAAGICAVSGASSVPGLSSAVVDCLAHDFAAIDEIQIAIAPGQQAPRGQATLRAVFGYAGTPIRCWRQGRWVTAHGWQDMRTLYFDGLGARWAAICDVPDLALFPSRYAGVKTVEFRAALELKSQHAALWAAAALRRIGLPLSLARHAGWLNRVSDKLLDRFGSPNGGMMVRVSGARADGRSGVSTWTLTAPGGSGPEIPCMAALLLAKRLALGALTVRGTMTCMGLLTLDDFAPYFAQWAMRTAIDAR
ncbi:MAG: saccharopine dehydrogenase NADP-binding domain-containing protein [Burkholderiaceae bacterium]|jgi:saccharopine dehydrogenase-like NADP-dependent oxidoreductase|nr:saccharopine dehydrogenase NADP-binding domain-containing protein [Burkholderiaceae bacterium]